MAAISENILVTISWIVFLWKWNLATSCEILLFWRPYCNSKYIDQCLMDCLFEGMKYCNILASITFFFIFLCFENILVTIFRIVLLGGIILWNILWSTTYLKIFWSPFYRLSLCGNEILWMETTSNPPARILCPENNMVDLLK